MRSAESKTEDEREAPRRKKMKREERVEDKEKKDIDMYDQETESEGTAPRKEGMKVKESAERQEENDIKQEDLKAVEASTTTEHDDAIEKTESLSGEKEEQKDANKERFRRPYEEGEDYEPLCIYVRSSTGWEGRLSINEGFKNILLHPKSIDSYDSNYLFDLLFKLPLPEEAAITLIRSHEGYTIKLQDCGLARPNIHGITDDLLEYYVPLPMKEEVPVFENILGKREKFPVFTDGDKQENELAWREEGFEKVLRGLVRPEKFVHIGERV